MERDVTKLFETSLIYPCSKFNYDQVVAIRSVKDGEVYLRRAALLNEKKARSFNYRSLSNRSLRVDHCHALCHPWKKNIIQQKQYVYHRFAIIADAKISC